MTKKQIIPTRIKDSFIFKDEIFSDDRGFFFESYNQTRISKKIGNVKFIQDNISYSKKNVIRGMHFQVKSPQGKLLRVLEGKIFDIIIDLRSKSKTFKNIFTIEISANDNFQLWIPPGLAHGFKVLSSKAKVQYKVDKYWQPKFEKTLRWDDPYIFKYWPNNKNFIISKKDAAGENLDDILKKNYF